MTAMVQFTAACIQTNCQDDMDAGGRAAEQFIREAHGKGAQFIALPENGFYMAEPGKGLPPAADKNIALCQKLAGELKVFILIGSAAVAAEPGKCWNRSLLIDDTGAVTARYDKIHLFDVTLANGETYSESARFAGGREAITAHTPWGKLGMTICYDVRFPHLYRTLAQAGAEFLSVPAAFTYTTGIAHWHILLRARAIENGAYVFAPAQCGMHPGKRRTFGHSLIIGPWGDIIAEGEDTPGIITAVIDTDEIAKARAMIPSLKHDKAFGMRSY